jgi:hypothetical protein
MAPPVEIRDPIAARLLLQIAGADRRLSKPARDIEDIVRLA